MWVQTRPVLPLSARWQNPLGGFGPSRPPLCSWQGQPRTCRAGLAKIVSCCLCWFTLCSLLSAAQASRSVEVTAGEGHVSTPGRDPTAPAAGGAGGSGVTVGALTRGAQPLLPGQEEGRRRSVQAGKRGAVTCSGAPGPGSRVGEGPVAFLGKGQGAKARLGMRVWGTRNELQARHPIRDLPHSWVQPGARLCMGRSPAQGWLFATRLPPLSISREVVTEGSRGTGPAQRPQQASGVQQIAHPWRSYCKAHCPEPQSDLRPPGAHLPCSSLHVYTHACVHMRVHSPWAWQCCARGGD